MSHSTALSPVQRGRSWQLEEHVNNRWRAIAPRGVTVDDVMESRLWETVAPDLRPLDRISIVGEGGDFWADLLVIEAAPGALGVRVLWHEMLPAPAEASREVSRSGARG